MVSLERGRYTARLACGPQDIEMAQALRGLAFGPSPSGGGLDVDGFDAQCDHVLIEDLQEQQLVCCFRFLPLASGAQIETSYSAQFYDLAGLGRYKGPMVEMGRFCVHPEISDPDILRIAWGAMTAYVDLHCIEILFGCTSFRGTDPRAYFDTFGLLKARYLGPEQWRPGGKAAKVFPFAKDVTGKPDTKRALLQMPPLLRTYLMMGGWVSDHAVVDRQMDTIHVFTGVEIALIPPARKRLLRTVAGAARQGT